MVTLEVNDASPAFFIRRWHHLLMDARVEYAYRLALDVDRDRYLEGFRRAGLE